LVNRFPGAEKLGLGVQDEQVQDAFDLGKPFVDVRHLRVLEADVIGGISNGVDAVMLRDE